MFLNVFRCSIVLDVLVCSLVLPDKYVARVSGVHSPATHLVAAETTSEMTDTALLMLRWSIRAKLLLLLS